MNSFLGIKQKLSTAYHPQTNGLVERFNRTLKEGIRKMAEENKSNWDLFIPAFLYAYRVSPHDSTQVSPYEAMFGRKPNLPILTTFKGMPKRNKQWLEDLQETTEKIRSNILKSGRVNEEQYNTRNEKRMTTYQIGDLVKIRNKRHYEPGANKLEPIWNGPYKVTKNCGNGVYELQDMENEGNTTTLNVTNIAKWKAQQEEIEPNSYEVESIKNHRFDDDGTLRFKIRWRNYSPKYDTYERLINIDAEEKIKIYMTELSINNPIEYQKVRKYLEQHRKTLIEDDLMLFSTTGCDRFFH
jgi:hypothetical protein